MPKSILDLAKKTQRTDFGTYEDYSARREDTKIETPVGTYICYHDGTFSDIKNRLMWIQGYWGMTYNGKKFKGERFKVSWHDATKLFGYGGTIPVTAGLRTEDIEARGCNEYKRGNCVVTFSGYSDWRLPTAKEILTLGLCVTKEHDWQPDEPEYEGYRYPEDSKSQELRENLFPDCPNFYGVWSANDNGYYGWCYDGQRTLGDYKKDDKFSVLFVRNL